MKVEAVGERVVISLTLREAEKFYNHAEYSCRPSLDWTADTETGVRYLSRKDCISGAGGPSPGAALVRGITRGIEALEVLR